MNRNPAFRFPSQYWPRPTYRRRIRISADAVVFIVCCAIGAAIVAGWIG